MIQDRRFLLKFDAPPSHNERLARFLSPYDLRIYVTPTAYFDIGSGSLGAFEHITYVHQPAGFEGCLGSIGRWCEFGQASTIVGFGDHDHDAAVNVSLGSLRLFAPNAPDIGMLRFRPFNIGSGVIVSAGARILSGVTVGDGAVIGADALVHRDVEPFSIVAGVPAREIRKRPSRVRWWDWPVDTIIANMGDLEAAAMVEQPFRPDRPRFVLIRGASQYVLSRFVENGVEHPLADAPVQVQAYLNQAFAPDMREAFWVPDCWAT